MKEITEKQRKARSRNGSKPRPKPKPGADGLHKIMPVTLDGAEYEAFIDLTRDKLRDQWRKLGRARVRLIRNPQLPQGFGKSMPQRNRISLLWGARLTGRWLEDRELGVVVALDGAHHALWSLAWHLSCADANQCAAALGQPVPWLNPTHAGAAFQPLYADGLPNPLSVEGRLIHPARVKYPAEVAGCIAEGVAWRPPAGEA